MEWTDRVLEPFESLREAFGLPGEPGEVFVLSTVVYSLLLIIAVFFSHWILLQIARGARGCAKRLAVGARLEDVVRLEASSAQVEHVLRWLAFRIVRVTYGEVAQSSRLPSARDEYLAIRIWRMILRRVWLMVRWIYVCIAALAGFFLSGLGVIVVVASTLTAFPDAIRKGVAAVDSNLRAVTWSEATLAAIVAAAVPLVLITARVVISERSVARRSFRRERNVSALEQLYAATPAIAALDHAIRWQMHETIRMFEIEKHRAEQWHKWTQRTVPQSEVWHREDGEHVECGRLCLHSKGPGAPVREYADDVTKAVARLQSAWKNGLNEEMPVLARVVSRRGWEGLTALRLCFSSSGEFWWHKLPAQDKWEHCRIRWQHSQLLWSEPTDSDVRAGRDVAVRAAQSPIKRWLERDLRDVVWELAELSRGLSNLGNFAQGLTHPARFESLARVSES